jgi:type IV pilus secretin PilQ/predicted competence protein
MTVDTVTNETHDWERVDPMNAHMEPQPATDGRRMTLAQFAVMAALAAAGGVAIAAGSAPVRLVGVSSHGNAVLIEASEPVAYAVANPDPLTVVVDLRNVTVQDAANRVGRVGPVAGVRLEQATASDGKAVARVRLSLTRPSEYKVRSARNTIRVELSPLAAGAKARSVDAPAPVHGPAMLVLGPDNGAAATEPEPDITLEQAIANAAAITPPQEAPDAMAALTTVPSSTPGAVPAARRDAAPAAVRVAPPAAGSARVAPPAAAPVRVTPPARTQTPAQQQPAPAASRTTAVVQQPQVTPSQQITGVPEKKFQGHPISMDFQGVDLRSVLRTFAEISGLNMVIDPDVQGNVDIVLNEVPWDQALEVILRGNQLDYTVDGTIVRIAKIDTLKKEQEQRQQLTKAMAEAGTLTFQTFSLSYAKAASVAPLLTKSQLLSTRGQVQIDERTNTLIVADLGERFTGIRQLLQTLDRPEPQVEVEARVVQTTREFARAIGIQWGLNGRMTPDVGNTTNLAFPNRGTLGGRTGTINQPVDPRSTELEAVGNAVNLGVPGATSAVGLALGAVNGAFNLDVALSALERTGKGRVLSTPRLTTQNNIEAEVAQGIQIPIQTVANNTVTVTFKEAVLLLKVNPQITTAGTVIMRITIENAAADFSRQVNGIPPIDTQRANTQVQVDDGATTVIGGIFVSREQTSIERTPILHRIPLLGWLFRRDTNSDESRELLIFITPRILKG